MEAKETSDEHHCAFASEMDSLIYIFQSQMSGVLLSFTFLCFAVFRSDRFFVVTSCQDWLGLGIRTDGQEAVWFFCGTVIRPHHQQHPSSLPLPHSLLSKCDAKHLKVLSPMIKDSSLSVAILRLIQAPTEQREQPKDKTQLSPRREAAYFFPKISVATHCINGYWLLLLILGRI